MSTLAAFSASTQDGLGERDDPVGFEVGGDHVQARSLEPL